MKKGLVHIKKQYDEFDKEYYDIEYLKIFYDSISGQYKHRFVCNCGKAIECMCFDSIEDAISGVEMGIQCDVCSVYDFLSESMREDDELRILIDVLEGTCFFKMYRLITDIEDGEVYKKATEKIAYQRIAGIRACIKRMLSRELSKETIDKIHSYMEDADWYDCDFAGNACTA
jgi:hypothetical protein